MSDADDPNIVRSKRPNIEFPMISLGEYIHKHLTEHNDKTLIICAKTGVSYNGNEIIKYAKTVANSLLKYGITKDDTILFHSDNNIQYAMTQIAALFLGVTFTASKPTHNKYELQNQLTDASVTIVLTSLEKAPVVKEAILSLKNPKQIKLSFVFDGDYEGFQTFNVLMESKDHQLKQIPYFSIDPKNDTTMIFYTSGSTGLPKGAMITHYGFITFIEIFKSTQTYPNGAIFSGHYPFGHISGTYFLGMSIANGSTFVLIEIPNIETIISAIEKYRINVIGIFPAFAAILINGNMDNYDISCIKHMTTGGSSFPRHYGNLLIEKYKLKQFKEIYAMTECFGIVNENRDKYIPGNVGTVAPNMEMKIIDLNNGIALSKDCDGEICFRGPSMFKGYLNNPQATALAIDEHGWFHTGDVGHYDEEGYLFITDRIKEMVKFRMYTAFPAEVEDCLMQHEAIYEAVVIGVKHVTDGEWMRAYVILKKGKEISGEEIVKYISDNMAFHKQLRGGVVFVDSIPRTVIGKIDRQYFKNMCKNEIITAEC